jgi:hypothetical protein
MIVISPIFKIINKPAPSHSRGGSGEGSLRIKNTAINSYWYDCASINNPLMEKEYCYLLTRFFFRFQKTLIGIILPNHLKDYPDRARLEQRFKRFCKVPA